MEPCCHVGSFKRSFQNRPKSAAVPRISLNHFVESSMANTLAMAVDVVLWDTAKKLKRFKSILVSKTYYIFFTYTYLLTYLL